MKALGELESPDRSTSCASERSTRYLFVSYLFDIILHLLLFFSFCLSFETQTLPSSSLPLLLSERRADSVLVPPESGPIALLSPPHLPGRRHREAGTSQDPRNWSKECKQKTASDIKNKFGGKSDKCPLCSVCVLFVERFWRQPLVYFPNIRSDFGFSSLNRVLARCRFIIKIRNLFMKLVPELRENQGDALADECSVNRRQSMLLAWKEEQALFRHGQGSLPSEGIWGDPGRGTELPNPNV